MMTSTADPADDEVDAVDPRAAVRRRRATTRALAWISGVELGTLTGVAVTRALVGSYLLVAVGVIAVGAGMVFAHDLLHLDGMATVLFGLGWGFVIFTIDRYIVMHLDRSTGRRRWLTGMVRLLLAVLLAFVIAEPLVLRAFSREVQAEMAAEASRQKAAEAARIATDPDHGDAAIAAAQARVDSFQLAAVNGGSVDVGADPEVARLQRAYDAAEASRQEQERLVSCEADGSCGTGRVGSGPEWQRKLAELRRREAAAEEAKSQLEAASEAARGRGESQRSATSAAAVEQLPAAQQMLAQRQAARQNDYDLVVARIDQSDGLGAQMEALARLREERPSINTQYWLITLALVALDTSAVLLTLLRAPSVDDELRSAAEQADLAMAATVQDHDEQELRLDLVEESRRREAWRQARRAYTDEQLRRFGERSVRHVGASVDDLIDAVDADTSRLGRSFRSSGSAARERRIEV